MFYSNKNFKVGELRVHKAFAWFPNRVFERTGTNKGHWIAILFRPYYVIQEMAPNGKWRYRTGDYLHKSHAEEVLKRIKDDFLK